MPNLRSIGAVELSSIGVGYRVQDVLLKAASVELLVARTICSGKYFIVFGGNVGDVEASVGAALEDAGEAIIDSMVLPNVHEAVFPALGQSVALARKDISALGLIESFSGTSILAAADAAAKAANIKLFRVHVAMALGGKGFCLMTGSVADCEAGVAAGAQQVRERGLLVSKIVIPGPRPELFEEYL